MDRSKHKISSISELKSRKMYIDPALEIRGLLKILEDLKTLMVIKWKKHVYLGQ